MSMLFRRKAIIPVWVVVLGLLALYGSPMTGATGVLLIIAGIVVPAIMLILWREPPPTVAEVLHRVEVTNRAMTYSYGDQAGAPHGAIRRSFGK